MGWLWQLHGEEWQQQQQQQWVRMALERSKALHSGCSLPGRRGFDSCS